MKVRTIVFLFVCLLFSALAQAQAVHNKRQRLDSSRTEYIYYRIEHILRLKPDSAIALIRAGYQNGLFKGASGTLFTSREAGKGTSRESAVNMGTAEVIGLTDTAARVRINIYSRNKQESFHPGDLIKLETYPVAGMQRNLFYQLASLNIRFLSNARTSIVELKEILSNTDPDFEQKLAGRYAEEIRSFRDELAEYAKTDSRFSTVYSSGPFKGKTMVDVFGNTTWYDLMAYFHFVRMYPGNFMGNDWKINETYATWVLNNAPPAEENRRWLLPLIEKTDKEDLNEFLQHTTFYIRSDTLLQWTSRISELQQEGNTKGSLELCNKLMLIASRLGDRKAETEFLYNRAWLYDQQGELKSALEDAKATFQHDRNNTNYKYQYAGLLGKAEQLEESYRLYEELLKELPGNTSIMGNYGWYKLYGGHLEEARPLCRAAYFGEPGSMAYALNYGHTFLLAGEKDSARYYYQKCLNNLYYPNEFASGPRADFEFLFKKGWNRTGVAEMADWMEKEYREKYEAYTRSNEIWDKARKFYDNRDYLSAAATWKSYISTLQSGREPPYKYIHNALNWAGLSHYYARQYDSAIYCYKEALRLARQHLDSDTYRPDDPADDFILADYDRITNFYELTGNRPRAEQYKALYNAEMQKLKERKNPPQLHLIALAGAPGKDEYEPWRNTKLVYDSLLSLHPERNKKAIRLLLNGTRLTRDSLLSALNRVRSGSKPEDIFIFYYAGEYSTAQGQAWMNFNPSDSLNGRLPLEELLEQTDLVYANKKMLITDQPQPAFPGLMSSRYINPGANATEMIFLGPGMEFPQQDDGLSLFTGQFVKTLSDLRNKGSFTARELAEKTGYRIGREQYYLPVVSFASSKDFLLYEAGKKEDQGGLTRGLDIKSSSGNAEPSSNTTQRNYALIFATDEYRDPGFNRLANPINDATALGNLLKNEFGFEVTLIKNAGRDEMEKWLSDFRDNKSYGPNDQLLLFFAGHGVYHEKAKMGYLVANDSKLNDPTHKTYLSYSDLGNIYLKNISCNRIFLVLDACFAGTFFDNNAVRGSPDVDAKNLSTLMRNAANKRFYKGISSGAKQYVEDGKPGQHSPFAGSFLKTLFNKAMQKSFVTADEIIGEIKSNPPAATAVCEGNFHYSDPLSHFIFRLKTAESGSEIRQDNLKGKL